MLPALFGNRVGLISATLHLIRDSCFSFFNLNGGNCVFVLIFYPFANFLIVFVEGILGLSRGSLLLLLAFSIASLVNLVLLRRGLVLLLLLLLCLHLRFLLPGQDRG